MNSTLAVLCMLLFSTATSWCEDDPWDSFWRKDYQSAYQGFLKQTRKWPYWAVPVDCMAWCRIAQERYDEAETLFRRAIELDREYRYSLQGLEVVRRWRFAEIERAWSLYTAGSYKAAQGSFEAILKDREYRLPKEEHWRATLGLGYCALALGQYRNAISHFNVTLRKKSSCAKALEGLGYTWSARGSTSQAIRYLSQALKADSSLHEARMTLGWLHLRRKEWRKALKQYDEVIARNPREARAYLGRGYARAHMKDFSDALQAYRQSLSISTAPFYGELRAPVDQFDELKVLYPELAELYYEGMQFRLSLQTIDLAERAGIKGPHLALLRAAIHQRLGETELAEKELQALSGSEEVSLSIAVDCGTSRVEIQLTRASLAAWIAYRKGDFQSGLARFQKLVAASSDPDHRCGRAWCLFSLGRFEEAEADFAAVLENVPSYPDALSGMEAMDQLKRGEYNTAWSLLRAGDYAGARTRFDAIEGKPGRFPPEEMWKIDDGRGWCALEGGDTERAKAYFERALDHSGQAISPAYGLALIHFRASEYKEAVQILEALIARVPTHIKAQVLLGRCALESGRIKEARGIFGKVLAHQSTNGAALAGLGWCFIHEDKPLEARRSFQPAVRADVAAVDSPELIKLAHDHVELLTLIGEIAAAWYVKGNYERARELFAEAQKVDRFDTTHGRGRGMCAYKLGEYAEAVEALAPYLGRAPKSEVVWGEWSELLSALAWSHYRTQDYKSGFKVFERLAGLHGKKGRYPDPWDGMGWCALMSGDLTRAENCFLEAIRRTPRYESSLSGLEEVRRRAGDGGDGR